MRAVLRVPDEVIDLTTGRPPVDVGRCHVRLVVALLTVWLAAPAIVIFLWWSAIGWG